MGLSRGTLWEIAGNPDDIVIDTGGPSKENGLFVGWITRGAGHRYKPLLSTDAVFKTRKLAKHFMQVIVDFANKFTDEDLKPEAIKDPKHPRNYLTLNQDELNIVQDIVKGAKG